MSARRISQALSDAQAAGLDRLDARWLLAHTCGHDAAWLVAHDDTPLTVDQEARFAALCARRLAGEPYAYLVGAQEFHGLRLVVDPSVLIPRPDTETLVDWALALLSTELADRPAPSVVDLGTGSGAVALAVRHRCARVRMTALDASEAALAMAGRNARALDLPLHLGCGDWWQPVAGERFDLALSNPPYIASDDAHLTALAHEPLQALTPGGDGLDAIRRIVAGAPHHLSAGGWLLLEHGWDQADRVASLLRANGFSDVATRLDLGGRDRCTGGQWLPGNDR